jgi:hypothetical protein
MGQFKRLSTVLGSLGLLVCLQALYGRQSAQHTIKIPDGTPIRLSLMDSLSSATNEVDDPIHFETTEDVKVGDVVVLPKGSTASGHVVEAEPKKRLGRAGKLNFSVDSVKAPDGTNVRLRASSTRKGEEKSGTVIVGTVLLSPLFLLMRGKDVNIPKGTAFNAYIDGDREIGLGGPAPATQPVTTPAPAASEDLCTAVLKSTPDGADITVDGKYMGSTPSTLRLKAGDHTIVFHKSGFQDWQRTMTVSPGGIITIDANLERTP